MLLKAFPTHPLTYRSQSEGPEGMDFNLLRLGGGVP